MRDEIEKKFGIIVPLLGDLKGIYLLVYLSYCLGNVVRIGKLIEHQVKIPKGTEFRLFQKKHKLKGTERYCYCDLGDWFESLQIGDK